MPEVKLNQIVAVTDGLKTRNRKTLTELHHGCASEAISGVTRVYTPKDDDGDQLPDEKKLIHVRVKEQLKITLMTVEDYWNAIITQETGNTFAKADLIDSETGTPLMLGVPATVLLFLERQLVDLRTLVVGLPVLPPDKTWIWDMNKNCFITDPIKTLRTTKKIRPIVKYDATPDHPAQTDLITEDVVVGQWSTTYLSSALPAAERERVLDRIDKLHANVIRARQEANCTQVEQLKPAGKLLDHLFDEMYEN